MCAAVSRRLSCKATSRIADIKGLQKAAEASDEWAYYFLGTEAGWLHKDVVIITVVIVVVVGLSFPPPPPPSLARFGGDKVFLWGKKGGAGHVVSSYVCFWGLSLSFLTSRTVFFGESRLGETLALRNTSKRIHMWLEGRVTSIVSLHRRTCFMLERKIFLKHDHQVIACKI